MQAEQDNGSRSHIIKRPRLTRLLDECGAKIILLVAPAGYGKTTLAREWLADKPHVWHTVTDLQNSELWLTRSSPPYNTHDYLAQPESIAADETADAPTQQVSSWLVLDDFEDPRPSQSNPARILQDLSADRDVELLVTSRQRPTWASTRTSLYGTVFELNRESFTFDMSESERM